MTTVLLVSHQISQATLVYSENFDGTFTITSSRDAHVFDGLTTGNWFNSNNGVNTTGDTLNFTVDNSSNRTRGAGVWLDTTGWELGIVTVEFEVEGLFTASTGDASAFIQAYTASGVDGSNTVGIDIHGNRNLASDLGSIVAGTPTIDKIGGQTSITGVGTVVHTFTYAGEEEIGLMFVNQAGNLPDTSRNAGFSIDDVTVNIAPEPSCYTLLVGFVFAVMLHRHRA